MAGRGSKNTGIRLDIKLLQQEAQHRWLRPVEICEILTNYEKFQISMEPPNRPPSGSLYLFDRKALRYFRKDGHNWRKKKDGKTVREAHEKLKIGSVDVLHCYYAHGEENEYFQRRSYWLLEEEYMHIVFVHYLEVKVEIENPSRESSSEEIEEEPSFELRNSKLIDTATSSRSEDLMTINELVWRPEIPRRGIAPASGTTEIPISNGANVSQGASKKVFDSSKSQRTSKMRRINTADTSLSLDGAITTDNRSNPVEACREPVLEETLETMEVLGEPSCEDTSMPEEASRELTSVGISRPEEVARMPRVGPIAFQSRNRQPRLSALPPKKFHTIIEKGNRSSIRETEPVISNSQTSNSLSNSISSSNNEAIAGNAGSPSAASTLTSYEDVESEVNHQAMSKYPASLHFPLAEDTFENNKTSPLMNSNFLPTYLDEYREGPFSVPGLDYVSLGQREAGLNNDNQFRTVDLATWKEVFEQNEGRSGTLPSDPLMSSILPVNTGTYEDYNENFSQLLQVGFGVNSGLAGSLASNNAQGTSPSELASADLQDNLKSSLRQPLLGSVMAEEGLQKVDSFSKWMTKELDGVDGLNSKSSSNLSWQNIETVTAVDDPSAELENYSMSPSIGQEQLFDMHDFLPSCASTDTETKVMITGKFLVSPSDISKYNWSCMFGEVEVPAEVTGNGALCCCTPLHSAGRVPFYVTCSNSFACSQVREFEFLEESQSVNSLNTCGSFVKERQLLVRLEKLLSMRSPSNTGSVFYDINKKPIIDKILLLMEDELCSGVERYLKEKVVAWLLDKANEDGKGPNILDQEGQGLLHLAAALGYDWIIPPTLASGVSLNFRDINGWTALHWAASSGRENTVALLISLGAAPGALSDPSPEFPLGRTPADLASANGYKGISGFLAESSLTAHLASLTMTHRKVNSSLQDSILKAVQTIKERVATPGDDDDGSDLSLKDSLAAVQNATQAAGRIHQVFRMQSFQRKQINDCVRDESLLTDERVLSLISSKIQKPGHPDELAHSAAIHIQKKFRGWKQRKEFLVIRERVVKIQAHVRGHQVRKRYKTIVWSVGILEKVILRWRRKGTGLRGFRSNAQSKAASSEARPSEEDDYDFLKEGRKQTEERLQKALVRVKSMVQYPEGRAQYRRLLTAFQKHQQQACNKILNSSESVPVVEGEEYMINVESLLDDDNFMAIAFE